MVYSVLFNSRVSIADQHCCEMPTLTKFTFRNMHFLLILCDFHIMHLKPTHLPTPLHQLSILATSPIKENKKQKPNHLVMEAAVSQYVLQFTHLSKHLYL